jgi:hypothetical protein
VVGGRRVVGRRGGVDVVVVVVVVVVVMWRMCYCGGRWGGCWCFGLGLRSVSRVSLVSVCNVAASVPAHGRAWCAKKAGISEAAHDGV